jgi:enterochelin esterase family protein
LSKTARRFHPRDNQKDLRTQPLACGSFAKRAIVQKVPFLKMLFGRERDAWVAVPKEGAAGANLLIVFDGPQYLDEIPLPAILDSLTAAGAIGPTVAVMIDNGGGPQRIEDLGNRAAFADWLADQLVPWMRARYQLSKDPHHTVAMGSSAGGLAAAFVALRRTEVIGDAISLSGAFWRADEAKASPPWEWLTSYVSVAPKRDARFVLDVGEKETMGVLGGTGPSIRDANRRLKQALETRGYAVQYAEAPGGFHAPESWRVRLPAMLAACPALAVTRPAPRSAGARP